jgi:hypothetical protein
MVGKTIAAVLAVAFVGVGGVALAACNLLNGSGDLATGDGLANGSSPDGGRLPDGAVSDGDGGGGNDSGSGGDGGSTGDGGFIDDAGVDPKVKSCGPSLICLPNIAGWSPAALQVAVGIPNGQCPTGYPVSTTLQTSGGGRCDCTCTAGGGTCANGGVASKQGAGCTGATTGLGVTANQCSAVPATLPLPVAFVASTNDPAPTSCGAAVAPHLGAPRAATYCAGAVPASSGSSMCAAGEICVNRPNFPLGGLTCIVHDGDIACPNRLSFRTVVGTSVADGRSCNNTCACKPEACAGMLEAFSDGACATPVRTVNVDGSCTIAGADMTGSSFRYTPSLGCGVSVPAKVLGSETYTSPRTLCCTFGF